MDDEINQLTPSYKSKLPTYLREFVNYRHPGPRRVWKVGSELQSTTLDPVDPLDPLDPLLCRKVWFRIGKTLLFTLWPAPPAAPECPK